MSKAVKAVNPLPPPQSAKRERLTKLTAAITSAFTALDSCSSGLCSIGPLLDLIAAYAIQYAQVTTLAAGGFGRDLSGPQAAVFCSDEPNTLLIVVGTGNRIYKLSLVDLKLTHWAGEGSWMRQKEGQRLTVSLSSSTTILPDPNRNGWYYVADESTVRLFDANGQVSVFVGGKFGYADGVGTDTKFSDIRGMAMDRHNK